MYAKPHVKQNKVCSVRLNVSCDVKQNFQIVFLVVRTYVLCAARNCGSMDLMRTAGTCHTLILVCSADEPTRRPCNRSWEKVGGERARIYIF